MIRQSFAKGAAILIAASLVTRVLGFVYRIFLTRLIGAEGIGLFQMVFPLLTLALTIVTAGMGVAVAKIVAETQILGDRKRMNQVMTIATGITILLALVGTVALALFGRALATKIFPDPRAYIPFVTLIPVLSVIAISSVLRGYFQGLQMMSVPSIASIIETAVRIVAVWFIALLSLQKGLAYAAAGVSAGMIIGEFSGLVYMYIVYRKKGGIKSLPLPEFHGQTEPWIKSLRAILQLAIPVTLSRLLGSLAFAIEPILVTRSLHHVGYAAPLATQLYGEYSGMAVPLLLFPTVITYSLAIQLVPAISEAVAVKNQRLVERRLYQAFRATAIAGFPTSLILFMFATPLCYSLFHHAQVGRLLAIMAPAGFLLYLQAPLSGVLQGINHAGIAMRNSIIGAAIKLLFIYLLVSRPGMGAEGVAWSVTISVVITTLLHIASVSRHIGFYVDAIDTGKMLLATMITGFYLHYAWAYSAIFKTLTQQLLFSITTGLTLYILLLLMMRSITSHSFSHIPLVGKSLAKWVKLIPFAR